MANEVLKTERQFVIEVTMSPKVKRAELPGIVRKAGCKLEGHKDWGEARDECVILSKAGGILKAELYGVITKVTKTHYETWDNGDQKETAGHVPFHKPLTKKQKREQERPE